MISHAQGIDRERFALGSLSHIVNHNAFGYEPLPDFGEEVSCFRPCTKFSEGVSGL